MTHGDLVNLCLLVLSAEGCVAKPNPTGRVKIQDKNGPRWVSFGRKGSPDIEGCTPDGRYIGVECKVARDVQSGQQKNWQRGIEARGGLYFLARDNTDALRAYLRLKFGRAA